MQSLDYIIFSDHIPDTKVNCYCYRDLLVLLLVILVLILQRYQTKQLHCEITFHKLHTINEFCHVNLKRSISNLE